MLSNALEAALGSSELQVRHITPGPAATKIDGRRYEVDFSCPRSLQELHALLRNEADSAPIGALINLLPLSPDFAEEDWSSEGGELLPLWMFNTMRQFGGDLEASASEGGGVLLNITAMGGRFGLDQPDLAPPSHAASVGFTKSLAQEMPSLTVKNIDLEAGMPPESAFTHILEEILSGDQDIEVGVSDTGRRRLRIEASPIADSPLGELPLDHDSVVLITGGARGVTADVAEGLARAAGCRLVLVGRSELPTSESQETSKLDTPTDLRQHFISLARATNEKPSPAAIESQVRSVLREREITNNLERLRKHASGLEYHACDVRDVEAFGELIADIYARYDRVDGVIHGAGLIEDKLIRDKTPDSYQRVISTKVSSANTLARRLDPDSLRFLVFFASVSGRFGNAGQSDYAAANEYLSKLASRLDRLWKGRVLSVGWGPWDGGMITDELRRLYMNQGVTPMPPAAGVAALLNELRLPQGEPEILLGCDLQNLADLAGKRRQKN